MHKGRRLIPTIREMFPNGPFKIFVFESLLALDLNRVARTSRVFKIGIERELVISVEASSSETQGQIVGARESLNGRRKKSAKKSLERGKNTKRTPSQLPCDWAEKYKDFLAPIRSQNDANRLELVR